MFENHLFIVFCDEHYNPLGIIRSLGESGIQPVVIVTESRRRIASVSKYAKKIHRVSDMEEGYALLLKEYGGYDLEHRPFVLTADDKKTSLLDERYEEIKDKFYFYNAGEANRITFFMDKDNINKLAEKYGLNVAPTHVVKCGEIPEKLEYPIITKSISSNSGGWKDDVFICHSEEELSEAYQKIKSPVVLLQRYIYKKNELCLDGFTAEHGKKMFVSIASNYNYILPDKYSAYMTFKNFDEPELSEALEKMFREIGFDGIFSVEFLIGPDDRLYFCEINFRNSTWSYASTCLGMNLPLLWAEAMLTGRMPENVEKEIPQEYTAMVETTDFKTRVLGRKMGLRSWLKERRKCGCLFYYNKHDPKPFWSTLFSGIFR